MVIIVHLNGIVEGLTFTQLPTEIVDGRNLNINSLLGGAVVGHVEIILDRGLCDAEAHSKTSQRLLVGEDDTLGAYRMLYFFACIVL